MQVVSVERLVGQILGNYRVERLLGQSRLNAVYLARHLSTQENVALTLYLVPEHFTAETRTRFMQRFRDEANGLTTLHHPHILTVYEYGELAGNPYLVTPYMMHGSLADILRRQGRCSYDYVLAVLEQIVDGLEYAHSRGLIHGTLKPSNIVLGEDQSMQVAGFGLMHMLQMRGVERNEQPYAHLLSIAGTFLAASEYLAPEVVQGQSIDRRSDIYALGIILFELLAGKPPFTGPNPLEIARQQVQQPMPSLRALCPDIPIGLVSVVNQALERDPARRFQHASELAEAFTQVAIGATNANMRAVKSEEALSQDTGSWQLLPPIITGKLAAVNVPQKQNTAASLPTVVPAAPPAATTTDRWQFAPPIATGQFAAVLPQQSPPPQPPARPPFQGAQPIAFAPPASPQPSAYAPEMYREQMQMPVEPARPAQPSRDTSINVARASDWWLESPQNSRPLSDMEASFTDVGTSRSRPFNGNTKRARRSGPGRRAGVNTGRRKVVATLAAGGILAAGVAAFAFNKNLTNLLKPPASPANGATIKTVAQQPGAKGTPAKQQTKPATTATHTGTVIGNKTMAVNTAVAFSNPANKRMSLLVHLQDGKFVAYDRACTHEGISVNYDVNTQMLVCPAHGAIFNPAANASVVQGPATQPLAAVAIKVNADGTITVG